MEICICVFKQLEVGLRRLRLCEIGGVGDEMGWVSKASMAMYLIIDADLVYRQSSNWKLG
jgi:hypothetical protein